MTSSEEIEDRVIAVLAKLTDTRKKQREEDGRNWSLSFTASSIATSLAILQRDEGVPRQHRISTGQVRSALVRLRKKGLVSGTRGMNHSVSHWALKQGQ